MDKITSGEQPGNLLLGIAASLDKKINGRYNPLGSENFISDKTNQIAKDIETLKEQYGDSNHDMAPEDWLRSSWSGNIAAKVGTADSPIFGNLPKDKMLLGFKEFGSDKVVSEAKFISYMTGVDMDDSEKGNDFFKRLVVEKNGEYKSDLQTHSAVLTGIKLDGFPEGVTIGGFLIMHSDTIESAFYLEIPIKELAESLK